MIYWILKHLVIGPPVRLTFRPWVEGKHHVPEQGAAILASNHLSFSDSVFLPLVVDRHGERFAARALPPSPPVDQQRALAADVRG